MLPIVTDGTASKCVCAAADAAYSVLAAMTTVVTDARFIGPVFVPVLRLTSSRLKCNNCSHISRSNGFATVATAFPESPQDDIFRGSRRRSPRSPARRCERRFHFRVHEGAASATTERPRSEEHTSELQSRFGISYAVFCLK